MLTQITTVCISYQNSSLLLYMKPKQTKSTEVLHLY